VRADQAGGSVKPISVDPIASLARSVRLASRKADGLRNPRPGARLGVADACRHSLLRRLARVDPPIGRPARRRISMP